MSEVRVNNLSNENNTGGPTISGITTYSGRHFFVPPVGDTASRPSDCEPGSLRFNTDNAKLEYFRGDTIGWTEIEASNEELGQDQHLVTGQTGMAIRGLYAGGGTPTRVDTIDYIILSTPGNAIDFGNLPDTNSNTLGTVSSRSRALFGGGYPYTNRIGFVVFATQGNTTDFGNLSQSRSNLNGLGDGVRGVFVGGYTGSNQTTMDYVAVAQTGDAVDFGDLSGATNSGLIANSSTRGLIGGISNGTNAIDFITIRTTGNATDFGDMTVGRSGGAVGPFCNATRGIFAAGYSGGDLNVLDFVTMATKGNALDFGDLIQAASQTGAVSSPTRGMLMGGIGGSPRVALNTIQETQLASAGNTQDFGDISQSRNGGGGISNGHGGL